MTEKEIRRLSRADLLEMLIEQSVELETLREKCAQAEQKLEKRELNMAKVGTLAEACLRFNGVFDAADAAAQEYMEAVRARMESQRQLCDEMERESQELAEKLEQETRRRCSRLEEDTKIRCAEMLTKAKSESEAYWDQVSAKLDAYYEQHVGLREMLSFLPEKK